MTRILVLIVLLLGSATSATIAQVASVRVTTDRGGTAVSGAIVRLLKGGQTVARALTDDQGRVLLTAPVAGSYAVRVDRIGYAGITSAEIVLADGRTDRLEVRVPTVRATLPPLVVEGKTRCGSVRGDNSLAGALWEEITKALTASMLTEQNGAIPLRTKMFRREIDLAGKPIREWTVGSHVLHGQPFAALESADLFRTGFIYQERGQTVYAGPDAALLISDEFIATHCFHATPGEDMLVGLNFEPAPDRKVPDVRGTLWVNRATSELLFIEYRYANLPSQLRKAELGGRLEFTRLPGGEWIVSSWHVRMPRGSFDSQLKQEMVGYVDDGGRATMAAPDDFEPITAAVIRGTIFDSTTGHGLAGAVIRFPRSADSAVSDQDGRFSLAVEASGDQPMFVEHPKLALLDGRWVKRVLLSVGDTTTTALAVPSLATFAKTICGREVRPVLLGQVYDSAGKPTDNYLVRAVWPRMGGEEHLALKAKRRPGGFYGLCGFPPDRSVLVEQIVGNTTMTPGKATTFGRDEIRWLDLDRWSQTRR